MKKPTKKPSSKKANTITKTQVKRPAHKKPRPKKHIDAKIPALPPVSTKTKEAKVVDPATITLELPENITEPQLLNAVNVANKELKTLAERAKLEKDMKSDVLSTQLAALWGEKRSSQTSGGKLSVSHFQHPVKVRIIPAKTYPIDELAECLSKGGCIEKPKWYSKLFKFLGL
jgi:hypothetical protein